MKWDTKRVALSSGIIWGAGLFLTTIVSVYSGYAKPFLDGIASIYPGYSISLTGSIIGAIYGFLDFFIGTYVFVWVYKRLGK